MNLFWGNRGTKLYKLEDEKMVSQFIKRRTNKENVWEHRNIGQFWKGTWERGGSIPIVRIFGPISTSRGLFAQRLVSTNDW